MTTEPLAGDQLWSVAQFWTGLPVDPSQEATCQFQVPAGKALRTLKLLGVAAPSQKASWVKLVPVATSLNFMRKIKSRYGLPLPVV
jgi:hypothetical protein